MYLLPKYKTLLEREKVQTKEVKIWSEDSELTLQACFDCTDWDMFKQSCGDLDELADVVCSYTTFCRDMIVATKTVKVYPNNRPWVNNSIRSCLYKKRLALCTGTAADLHLATKELKAEIGKAKQKYKSDLENKLANNNLGSVWSSMKSIVGLQSTKGTRNVSVTGFDSDADLANALNVFYNRFDTSDFNSKNQELHKKLLDTGHFTLKQEEVEKAFRCIKLKKSSGPDICSRLLKSCSKELSPIFRYLFDKSLEVQHVPKIWKDAIVVPVPKSSSPSTLNDFRPVALTSIPMKIFEKMVRSEIIKSVEQDLDPMQFAYRPKRGVENATLTLLHLLLKHLEGKGHHARLLFIDFSSAFNTMYPHILIQRLLNHFNLNNNLLGWILDFLTCRTQRVRVNGLLSESLCSSIGSPQGCVLSPILFILYTNMCQSPFKNRFILKYADDTVIVSLLKEDEEGHGPIVDHFAQWCEESNLILNATKTKDMIIDFRRNIRCDRETKITSHNVELVKNYKYLGTILDSSLSFEANCEAVCKKGHQRLFCLGRLSHFHIGPSMLTLFYRAFIEPVLSFSLVAWFGSLTLKDKNRLTQIIKWSNRLIGNPQLSMDSLYNRQLFRISHNILSEESHPLYDEFHLLPSGRRFQVPSCRTKRYRSSFVPCSIVALNNL